MAYAREEVPTAAMKEGETEEQATTPKKEGEIAEEALKHFKAELEAAEEQAPLDEQIDRRPLLHGIDSSSLGKLLVKTREERAKIAAELDQEEETTAEKSQARPSARAVLEKLASTEIIGVPKEIQVEKREQLVREAFQKLNKK